MNVYVENSLDKCAEMTLFAIVGNLCGRLVNKVDLLLNPSLFVKAPAVNLKAATSFCVLFITIDQLAKQVFAHFSGIKKNRFSSILGRLALSCPAAFLLHKAGKEVLHYSPLNSSHALIITIGSVFLYSLVRKTLATWEESLI